MTTSVLPVVWGSCLGLFRYLNQHQSSIAKKTGIARVRETPSSTDERNLFIC